MNLLRKIKKLQKERPLKKGKEPKKLHSLDYYLAKAGFTIRSHLLSRGLFKFVLALNVILTFYILLFFASAGGYSLPYVLVVLFVIWSLAFFIFLGLIWLAFLIFLDLRIFQRNLSMEDVLPDFLHLAATNLRSGMTVDQALWFAVRPRFGVLAKEIETVAKEVMSGQELTDSLERFAAKYDSDTLKRSINLLVEGINSGGEMGELLTRIANNIQESKLMKQEMSASVMSYVIFITFAAVVAAPLLLALSNQLIMIIRDIVSKLDIPATGNMMFVITNISVAPGDFKIFAYCSMFITSLFSAMIISTIRKGNISEGAKYIPAFIFVSIVIYLISSKLLATLLAGYFV